MLLNILAARKGADMHLFVQHEYKLASDKIFNFELSIVNCPFSSPMIFA